MSVHAFANKRSATAATVAFVLWAALGVATPAVAQVQTAVEYWRNGPGPWDYDSTFFYTTFPDEIAALDGGAFGRAWLRTGRTFDVWSGPESGALPTCRFFNALYGTHFFTPYVSECVALQASPDWQYEGIAFYLRLPDENGNCPTGTTVLYRLYNNGMSGWPVHILITALSLDVRDPGWAGGWVFEGDGRTAAFACVPSATTPSMP